MKLLAIETATDACSVALSTDGRVVTRETLEPRSHAERVLDMVNQCLSEAGLDLHALDGLAFGRGPGSFTGVRIATGVVQGLSLGADLPVVPVSTLAGHSVAAWRRLQAERIAVAVDARMGECYWGCFQVSEAGVADPVGEELIVLPEKITAPPGEGWLGVGSAWTVHPGLAGRLPTVRPAGETILPSARDLLATAAEALARGESVPAERALPVYLREKVAWQGGSSKK